MAFSTTTNKALYSGNGVTTNFAAPFLFYSNAHIEVYLIDKTTGASTLQTLTTNYTVSGAGVVTGGTVTMLVAPASTVNVLVRRIVPQTQGVDLKEGDKFPPDTIEQSFDLGVMLSQQLAEVDSRCVKLPVGTALTSLEIPDINLTVNRGKVFQVKSDGTGFDTVTLLPAPYASPLTTKGDTPVFDGSVAARLPVGANESFIEADSAQPLGVKWTDFATKLASKLTAALFGILTTKGDTFVSTGATVQRSVVGSNGQVRVADSGNAQGLAYKNVPILVNLLPNTQWQVMCALGGVTAMSAAGTGTLPAISSSANTTGSNTVVCTTANTGELAVGDLVLFDASANANMRLSALQVTAVVPNTSFTVKLPLGAVAGSTSACSCSILTRGDYSGANGDGADGWSKDVTLNCWREVRAANTKSGSRYSMGLKKTVVGSEAYYYTVPTRDLETFRGRTVVFGAWVYQKIKGGAGTFKLRINDGVTQTISASGTSGSYQWLEVTATIDPAATSVSFLVDCDGTTNDVYYLSQPMLAFGSFLGQGNYVQNPRTYISPKVKITPGSINALSWTTPAGVDAGGTYGWAFRPYPETNGAIAPTILGLNLQLEGKTAAGAGNGLALRNQEAVPNIFGVVMYATGTSVMGSFAGIVTLDANGEAWMYGTAGGVTWANVSIDINGAWA